MKKVLLLTMVIMGVIMAPLSGVAQEQKSIGDVEWDNGVIKFKSDDGNFMTRFDVRLYLDAGKYFEDENDLSNGTHLRKARFAMKTKL